jgi:hypothetical protein
MAATVFTVWLTPFKPCGCNPGVDLCVDDFSKSFEEVEQKKRSPLLGLTKLASSDSHLGSLNINDF